MSLNRSLNYERKSYNQPFKRSDLNQSFDRSHKTLLAYDPSITNKQYQKRYTRHILKESALQNIVSYKTKIPKENELINKKTMNDLKDYSNPYIGKMVYFKRSFNSNFNPDTRKFAYKPGIGTYLDEFSRITMKMFV